MQSALVPMYHTKWVIVAKIINYICKTVITAVITAVTQWENVITNRYYNGDEDTFATITTFRTVLLVDQLSVMTMQQIHKE